MFLDLRGLRDNLSALQVAPDEAGKKFKAYSGKILIYSQLYQRLDKTMGLGHEADKRLLLCSKDKSRRM